MLYLPFSSLWKPKQRCECEYCTKEAVRCQERWCGNLDSSCTAAAAALLSLLAAIAWEALLSTLCLRTGVFPHGSCIYYQLYRVLPDIFLGVFIPVYIHAQPVWQSCSLISHHICKSLKINQMVCEVMSGHTHFTFLIFWGGASFHVTFRMASFVNFMFFLPMAFLSLSISWTGEFASISSELVIFVSWVWSSHLFPVQVCLLCWESFGVSLFLIQINQMLEKKKKKKPVLCRCSSDLQWNNCWSHMSGFLQSRREALK